MIGKTISHYKIVKKLGEGRISRWITNIIECFSRRSIHSLDRNQNKSCYSTEMISDNIKKMAPDCLQIFDEIESQYKVILQYRKDEISPYGPSIPPNQLVYNLKVLEQFCLHRTCDFVETLFTAWAQNRPAVAFVLDRAIMETNALLYNIQDRINSIIQDEDNYMEKLAKQIVELNQFTTQMIQGNRFDERAAHKAINILTIIDKVDKKIYGFRKAYNFNSEFAHPNNWGLQGLYGKIDDDRVTFRINNKNGVDKISIEIFFPGLRSNLDVLLQALQGLSQIYDKISIDFQKDE